VKKGRVQWWNGTDRGKLKYWKKTFYSVCGCWRWVWSNGGMLLTGGNWITGRKTLYRVGGRWRCVWSNGGMVLTVGNGSTGRKKLYSVGGRWRWVWSNCWMILTGETEVLGGKHYIVWVVGGDGYGARVEWYWKVETEVLGGKLYIVWVVGEDGYGAMVERYWQGKLHYCEENIILCGR